MQYTQGWNPPIITPMTINRVRNMAKLWVAENPHKTPTIKEARHEISEIMCGQISEQDLAGYANAYRWRVFFERNKREK